MNLFTILYLIALIVYIGGEIYTKIKKKKNGINGN